LFLFGFVVEVDIVCANGEKIKGWFDGGNAYETSIETEYQ
jgi:hypothetical protein